MSAVLLKEVVEALRDMGGLNQHIIASLIEQHGITPPDGWVLVPKEPTNDMIDAFAGENYLEMEDEDVISFTKSYKAMLAAAPEVPNER